ncbi:MAG TPA: D-2-hydroxyacid dehydrogenase [Xanthobacteraceae bacterium]|jgi:D-2-hydroxyacid dehydrogenase (NADP+)|nr:D-2-hydroxyacid dehydrogenase [Xanthobacteraceae bacterium]
MNKVLVIDQNAAIYRDRLQAEFPALQIVADGDGKNLPQDLSDIEVFISFAMGLPQDFYRRASGLKWLQCLATGVDHVLRQPDLGPAVVLTSGRGVHGAPMRETVLYLMQGISRNVARLVEDNKAHIWERRFYSLLYGRTAVVVGIGVVGIAIGQLLKAFGMRVIGVTRTPRQAEGFDDMLPMAQLNAAAARADFLINVLPATAENARVFGRELFAAMKPSAYYINAGRGQTTDEAALVEALQGRRIAGAGLDVFQTEPLPAGSPLWELPNVFITPHLGGYTSDYEDLIMPLITENLRLYLAGRHSEMQNIVKR